MPWMPCCCAPPDWLACGTTPRGPLYLPKTMRGLFTIAGGLCPCATELHGYQMPLTWTSGVFNPLWQSNAGANYGYIRNICTNGTVPLPPPLNFYYTAYSAYIECLGSGVVVNVEAHSQYQNDPGYACSPDGIYSVTIPYTDIDPTAPQFQLTGMPLTRGPTGYAQPCPCAGRILTYTVTI